MSSGDALLAIIAVSIAAYFIIYRLCRTINIWKNGWPPPHCDADGDAVDNEFFKDVNKN